MKEELLKQRDDLQRRVDEKIRAQNSEVKSRVYSAEKKIKTPGKFDKRTEKSVEKVKDYIWDKNSEIENLKKKREVMNIQEFIKRQIQANVDHGLISSI